MSYPAFTGGAGYQYSASFLAVYVNDTTSSKYQTLGEINNAVLEVSDFASPNSRKQNRAMNAYKFTASCRMMQSSLTEQELLALLCNGTNSFLFKLADAVSITASPVASAGWVAVTAAQVNCKAKPVFDGTSEDDRYIELMWQGTIYKSDSNEVALYTPTLQTSSFASTSDSATAVFYAIGTYTATADGGSPTPGHLRKCGVSTLTFDVVGGSSPVTIAPVNNIKLSFDMLAGPEKQDSLLRYLPSSMDVSLEADCMATKNSDLLLLGNMSAIPVKIIVTFMDAFVVTLDNQVGIQTKFGLTGDADGKRAVTFTHTGSIEVSAYNSMVSA